MTSGRCYIIRYPSETHLKTQISGNLVLQTIVESFWNFVQRTAVSLPCAVQNFKTIWHQRTDFARCEFKMSFARISHLAQPLDSHSQCTWVRRNARLLIEGLKLVAQNNHHRIISIWNTSQASFILVGVTKPITSVPLSWSHSHYFSEYPKHQSPIDYHVHIHIWQVSTQLSCGDTCQILMWFKTLSWIFQNENCHQRKYQRARF